MSHTYFKKVEAERPLVLLFEKVGLEDVVQIHPKVKSATQGWAGRVLYNRSRDPGQQAGTGNQGSFHKQEWTASELVALRVHLVVVAVGTDSTSADGRIGVVKLA